jgi:cyclic beta-1,2-glucan synthetase
VADFTPLAQARGDDERATPWLSSAQGWRDALNGVAWDGQWFCRAYFDNGQALGSHANAECQIDLMAQSWSVLSGAGDPALRRAAMVSVERELVDQASGLICLLKPPLAHAVPSAGYIQAYPPGVRENGGQYAHAGVWALMAQARLATSADADVLNANADIPYRYFTYLSPAHRWSDPGYGSAYGLEPYVMAGDVYSQPPYVGRGGWSWYTGAAAWLHRAAIESIFGLQWGATTLSLRPCLPSHWPRATLSLRQDGRRMHIIFTRQADLDAVALAEPQWAQGGSQVLRAGEQLDWRDLPDDTRLLMVLPA